MEYLSIVDRFWREEQNKLHSLGLNYFLYAPYGLLIVLSTSLVVIFILFVGLLRRFSRKKDSHFSRKKDSHQTWDVVIKELKGDGNQLHVDELTKKYEILSKNYCKDTILSVWLAFENGQKSLLTIYDKLPQNDFRVKGILTKPSFGILNTAEDEGDTVQVRIPSAICCIINMNNSCLKSSRVKKFIRLRETITRK